MDDKHLLVINSGSSSIKFAIYGLNDRLDKALSGVVEQIGIDPVLKLYDPQHHLIKETHFPQESDYLYFFELLLSSLKANQLQFNVIAAGHRVVHGGIDFYEPTLVSQALIEQLKKLIPFAPLHQPYNLQAIEAINEVSPKLPQIACFDTAFHKTHPAIADAFAIPLNLSQEGVKRYGFHGLSYEFIMHQLEQINAPKRMKRVVIAHLGNGASMCAVKEGRSIDSTMGFTALDGLMMGTRCGSLDPGVLLYLLEFKNMSYREIQAMLYKKSGLLGVSGISSDVHQLLQEDDPQAQEALDLFTYRICRELGALTAVLGGLDMLVFTGGIGEHAWSIREAVCQRCEWLGIHLNLEANQNNELCISSQHSAVDVYVIPTDEEWIIANHCKQLLDKGVHHG